MTSIRNDRRSFLKSSVVTVAAGAWAWALPARVARAQAETPALQRPPRLRFGVIGLNHGHIYSQVAATIAGGGELVSFYAKEPDLVEAFAKRYPQAKLARSEREILEDPSIKLVVSASIPNERAPLGIEVMRHGKDFMVDKPGHDHARAARGGAPGAGGDEAHLLDHVQRAAREPGDGQGGRAGEGRRHRQGDPDRRPGAAPHDAEDAARPGSSSASATAGSSATSRSHQFDQFLFFTGSTQGRRRGLAGGQRAPSRVPGPRGLRRRDAARRRRQRLHPGRLVHARRPAAPGATRG